LSQAIEWYGQRIRRFGKTDEQVQASLQRAQSLSSYN